MKIASNFSALYVCALAGLALFSGTLLYGQSRITGAINGVVTDPSEALTPGASVTVENTATAVTHSTVTNASGYFQFTAVRPSRYIVTVKMAGFGVSTQNVIVYVGQTTAVNFRLSVAGTKQTVKVSAALAPILQTANADLSTTLTNAQLQQVPIPGNDIDALLQMAPGAVMTFGTSFPAMYGQTSNSNMLISNGMEDINPINNSNNGGATSLLLGLNEVQEATVTSTAYTGQFGYLSGSNDTIVTKSGSNQFHGNAKYFWNGRALNANNYFNNASGTPRPFENANQWAASLGGPIMKSKLFFFTDTEGIRLVLPTSQLVIIPSQQFEAATIENLQNLGLTQSIPFYCQNLTLKDAKGNTVTCPVGGTGAGHGMFNIYNTSIGAARAVVGNGNPADPTGCNGFTKLGAGVPCALNYRSTADNFTPEWMLAGRVDWNVNPNNHVFGHVKFDNGTASSYTDPISPIFNVFDAQNLQFGQLGWTTLLGPSAVNEFAMSAEHFHINASAPASTLAAFPTALVFGDGTFTGLGGIDEALPIVEALTDYHFSDNLTKTVRNHTFKGGYDFTRYDVGNSYYTNAIGLLVPLTADAFYSGGIDQASVGAGGSDFTVLTQGFVANGEQPIAQYHMGGFFQDQWQVKNTLSLTLALRLDHSSNPICPHDCFARTVVPFSSLDHNVNVPYNRALQTGLRQSLYNLQTLEWQPRFGFAWQPLGIDRAAVVRGGVGLFYNNLPINVGFNLAGNVPLVNTFIADNGPLAPTQPNNLFFQTAQSNAVFLSGFSKGFTLADFQKAVPNFSPPQLQGVAGNMPEPLVTKWSLEIQKGLWQNAALTAGYVGNRSVHEWIQNGSANAYAANFAGLPATAPDPRFGAVTVMEDVGSSNYNGANISFVDRFGGSIVQLNYTYSHNLTVGTGTENPRFIEDPYDPKRSYGNADFDVRHAITANYVWTVPFAHFIPAAPKRLTDGWQLSEAFYIHSGFPYTVYDSATNNVLSGQNYASSSGSPGQSASPAYGVFANFNGGPVKSCTSPKEACLVPSQFSSASAGFGNQELNQFRGPKFVSTDFALMKITKIGRNITLGVGAQAYNLFNHPNFAPPDHNLADPTFGQIVTTVGSPGSLYGFIGADNSPRLLQIKGDLEF